MFRRRKDEGDGSMSTTGQGAAEPNSGDLPALKPFMRAGSEETLAPPSRPAVAAPVPSPRRLVDLPGVVPRPGASSLSTALANTGVSSASVPAPVTQGESKKLIVGREIRLNGEITSCEHLVVEGSVEAMLADGKMVDIAESGTFRGSVECETAQIRGRFDGDLTCNERLVVHSTGRVVGKVRYRQLEVERGGEISGDMQTIQSSSQSGAQSSTVTPIFGEDEEHPSGSVAAASADR